MNTPISSWRPKSCAAKGLWRVARTVQENKRRKLVEELRKPGGKVRWFRSLGAAARCAERVNSGAVTVERPWDGRIRGLCNCSLCTPARVVTGRQHYISAGYTLENN